VNKVVLNKGDKVEVTLGGPGSAETATIVKITPREVVLKFKDGNETIPMEDFKYAFTGKVADSVK
jgi:hypothetical protein